MSNISTLFTSIMTVIRTDEGLQQRLGLPGTMSEEQRKTYAQGQVLKILTGDYSPFDPIYLPLREVFTKAIGGNAPSSSDRLKYVTEILAASRKGLEESASVNSIVGQHSKEDGDVIGRSMEVFSTFVKTAVDLFLDFDATTSGGKFSERLKILVEDFVGNWVKAVEPQLEQGMAGVHILLQTLTQSAVQQFVSMYPENMAMAMMGGPMLTAHFLQSYQAYLARNNATK